MGMFDWLPFGNKSKNFLRAIIVYPNKNVKMEKIEGDKPTFSLGGGDVKRSYAIDQKAVYFFNKQPLLFYSSTKSSPLIISDGNVSNSMDSSEFRSILESKAVHDLLEASKGGGWDIQFIATLVSAIGVVILFLQGGGMGFLGIGG